MASSVEDRVSAAHIMSTDNRDTDEHVKLARTKRRAFWHGVLEGFSGPALLASQPNFLKEMVEVRDNKVRLRGPYGKMRTYALSAHADNGLVARSIAEAAEALMKENNLYAGKVRVKRLDHSGKLRELSRLQIKRRAQDASSE